MTIPSEFDLIEMEQRAIAMYDVSTVPGWRARLLADDLLRLVQILRNVQAGGNLRSAGAQTPHV